MPPKPQPSKGKKEQFPVVHDVPGYTQPRRLESGTTLGMLKLTWPKCYLERRQDRTGADNMIFNPSFVLEDGVEYTFKLPGRGDSTGPSPHYLVELLSWFSKFLAWDCDTHNGSNFTRGTDLGGTADDLHLLLEKKHS
eukprot:TRINITY_DN453_c0_g1_i2.p1 TRINITY_DN453_c0_g1~~TRINITY_DN453_c0_g1_i2.p1  ORF type:complete len:138 (-),score=20.82 TRINITY_DN453_c0_g1_i2:84-497(-)